jgi:hypothetical protein
VLSASSIPSKVYIKEDRSITINDIKLIMSTLLILLFTIFVMVTVIPYAFSSVIKQLKAVHALEAAGKFYHHIMLVFYASSYTFNITHHSHC